VLGHLDGIVELLGIHWDKNGDKGCRDGRAEVSGFERCRTCRESLVNAVVSRWHLQMGRQCWCEGGESESKIERYEWARIRLGGEEYKCKSIIRYSLNGLFDAQLEMFRGCREGGEYVVVLLKLDLWFEVRWMLFLKE
jgi:hypothetical protein